MSPSGRRSEPRGWLFGSFIALLLIYIYMLAPPHPPYIYIYIYFFFFPLLRFGKAGVEGSDCRV